MAVAATRRSSRGRARHQREQRELVEDPAVDRRRLEEDEKRLARERVEVARASRNALSMSTVSVSDPSRFRMRFSRAGSRLFASTKLTHQTTPSRSKSSGLSVAKCSATSGEYVQSSSRVGRPRCWPSASQSQIESAWPPSVCAYLRKLRSSASSSRRDVGRRREPDERAGRASGRHRDRPRNANGERNRCSAGIPRPLRRARPGSRMPVLARGIRHQGESATTTSLQTGRQARRRQQLLELLPAALADGPACRRAPRCNVRTRSLPRL